MDHLRSSQEIGRGVGHLTTAFAAPEASPIFSCPRVTTTHDTRSQDSTPGDRQCVSTSWREPNITGSRPRRHEIDLRMSGNGPFDEALTANSHAHTRCAPRDWPMTWRL